MDSVSSTPRPATQADRINHVSILTLDIDESTRFYCDVFGMERVPAPNFGIAVAWLRLGNCHLHLLEAGETPPPGGHHFAIEVDDFEGAYRALKQRRALEALARGEESAPVWVLPNRQVQMFARDPSYNLFEVNWPDIDTLDRSVFERDLCMLSDVQPQGNENRGAALILGRRGAPPAV